MSFKEKVASNQLVYLFTKSWHYAKGSRKKLSLAWIIFIVAGVINLMVRPWAWASIMNIIQSQGVNDASIGSILQYLGLIIASVIVFWSIHGPARVLERDNAFNARLNYRKFLLQGVMNLPMRWHADHQSGDTIDKVEKGTTALFGFTEETFRIVYEGVNLFGSVAMLLYFFPLSGVIMLSVLSLGMWLVVYYDRMLMGLYRTINKMENETSAGVYDGISNIVTVITLRVERPVYDALIHKAEKPRKPFHKSNNINEFKWFIVSIFSNTTTVVVLGGYLLIHKGDAGGVMVGSIFLLWRYLEKVTDVFSQCAAMFSNIVRQRVSVENAEDLAKDFQQTTFTNHVLPSHWGQLEVRGLTFSYEDKDADIPLHLANINMTIKRGEKIAFVGESGSGKTTLLKIIRDLYQPQQLELAVDGHLIDEGFGGIARAISLCPQHAEIFATTIRENITLGAEYDDDTMRRFTDMACFTSVALQLPRGFDSSIKEKGVNLSGGQQQRLALARGLLAAQGKSIVLLDEPTSSLDVATEQSVYHNIFAGFSDTTIISSIHRLHLLSLFDTIIFFNEGCIVATGSLNELLGTCQPFRELYDKYSNIGE